MGVGDDLFLDFSDSGSLTESGGERGRKRKYSFPYCETTMDEGCGEMNFDVLSKEIKLEAEDSDTESNPFVMKTEPSASEFDENETSFPDDDDDDDDGIIMLHMDIRDPLYYLKNQLESRLKIDLENCIYTLQDSQPLEGHMNLVDQCVQGEGLVQVNVELKINNECKSINIVDVLKPAEEFVEIGTANAGDEETPDSQTSDGGVRWIVDIQFKKFQEKNKIPKDPIEWDASHVRYWFSWALKHFNLKGINLTDWAIDGKALCDMDFQTFKDKVPNDPNNLFWTHFELLRKCKIVAVSVHTKDPNIKHDPEIDEATIKDAKKKSREKIYKMAKNPRMIYMDIQESDILPNDTTNGKKNLSSFPAANSGQVQLWQFLLELLTDKNHRNAIQWLEEEGEFKLINPELVAQLWGERKNKPAMNYEKLSRALRYYYYGNMISKVPGKRFVYKFVCDLKMLVGYSAKELNALVLEAELNAKKQSQSPSFPIFYEDFIPAIP